MKLNAWTGAAALVLVFCAGVVSTYWWTTPATRDQVPAPAASPAAAGRAGAASDTVTLAPELMARAGIQIETVDTSGVAPALEVPAIVQPNTYRRVAVTALVTGRVTRVAVELGQRVARGTTLVEVYSPELAEARSRLAAAHADMEAGEAKLRRTERLVAIGSASQQELEQIRAEHVRHEAEVAQATARLRLFGIDPARPQEVTDRGEAVVRIAAPQPGVITERPATVGMTVDGSTPLVTIADLSRVWVTAEVNERDLSRVRTGADAIVKSASYPGVAWHGPVTYVSPEIRSATRTAQVRVEVANTDGRLRFGLYVTAALPGTPSASAASVSRAAVQTIGPDAVVFVASSSTGSVFRLRRVTLGEAGGDRVAVLEGLQPGEKVVTTGSFTLRAEAERLGVHPAPATPTGEPIRK